MTIFGLRRPATTVVASIFLLLLTACASGITRSGDQGTAKPYFAENGRKAGKITVALTTEAKAQLADNLKFNHETLLSTVRRAMEAKDLVSKQTDESLPSVEIRVSSVRVRSSFTAVMFGFMAGDDHIKADVLVRAPTGGEIQRFEVSTSYALGGIAGGQDESRMGWLYESFAKRTIEGLTGVESS